MVLYSYYRSSAAFRVRIALNLKAIKYETVPVNLLEGEHRRLEYLRINSQGLVPTLDAGDGLLLTQSPAILEWLEGQYPDSALLPSEVNQRALVRSLCSIIACDIHPICNLRVLNYLRDALNGGDDQKIAWIHHWIKEGFCSIEKAIAENETTRFSMGDEPTLADVYLIPQVYNALRFNIEMSEFPKILNIYHRCLELPAFKHASPEEQADFLQH